MTPLAGDVAAVLVRATRYPPNTLAATRKRAAVAA